MNMLTLEEIIELLKEASSDERGGPIKLEEAIEGLVVYLGGRKLSGMVIDDLLETVERVMEVRRQGISYQQYHISYPGGLKPILAYICPF